VQHVRIGKCDPEQIEQQVKLELSGRLPLDPETMVVRHVPVGDVFADGQQKQEIICLAASRESVFGCVELAKLAGLDIVGMHGEPMATLEAFGHLFRRDEDRDLSTLFVDLGATTTNAAISHGPRLVFAKTVPVGVDNFVRQFAASGNLTDDQATEMWLQQAIASHHGADATAHTEANGAAALATAPSIGLDGEALETITDDLQLCLGYHASMFEGRPVRRVIFSGGGAGHHGLCQRIAQTLALPGQLGDPGARLAPGGADDGVLDITRPEPGWAVAMGLSMLPTNR
jgi:Tfp pilus assembly PilM family ATPase